MMEATLESLLSMRRRPDACSAYALANPIFR